MDRVLSGKNEMMRDLNRCLVLNVVRNSEPISRIDIAKKLNLSPSAISNITNELIRKEFIREIGPGSSQNLGRKPTLLEVDSQTWYVIGVDLERVTSIKVGITNLKGKLIAKVEEPAKNTSPYQVVDLIAGLIDRLINKVNIKRERIIGIGMGAPGLLDQKEGKVIYSVYLGWKNISLRKLIEKKTGIPLIIDTDTNAPALAEQRYGAGKGARDVIYITIGPGLGAGIIIDGQIYHGIDGTAGEFGHTIIDPNGPLCSCGNYGCLETLVAESSMTKQVIEGINKGEATLINNLTKNRGDLTPEIIYKAALKGDKFAIQIIQKTGYYLGLGLVNLVNLLNPEVIVIGGDISQVADVLLKPVKEVVSSRALSAPAQRVKILASHFGKDAGILGAATLFLESVFQIPEVRLSSVSK